MGCAVAQIVHNNGRQSLFRLNDGEEVFVAVHAFDQAAGNVCLPRLPMLAFFLADVCAHDLEIDGAVLVGADEPTVTAAL